jgi:hypothetical protein
MTEKIGEHIQSYPQIDLKRKKQKQVELEVKSKAEIYITFISRLIFLLINDSIKDPKTFLKAQLNTNITEMIIKIMDFIRTTINFNNIIISYKLNKIFRKFFKIYEKEFKKKLIIILDEGNLLVDKFVEFTSYDELNYGIINEITPSCSLISLIINCLAKELNYGLSLIVSGTYISISDKIFRYNCIFKISLAERGPIFKRYNNFPLFDKDKIKRLCNYLLNNLDDKIKYH